MGSRPGRCSGARERVGRSGTGAIGCPTAARSRSGSGRRGQSGRDLQRATTRSAPPEAWLRDLLDEVRRAGPPGEASSGVTFAQAAAGVAALHRRGSGAQALDAEWLGESAGMASHVRRADRRGRDERFLFVERDRQDRHGEQASGSAARDCYRGIPLVPRPPIGPALRRRCTRRGSDGRRDGSDR